MLPVWMILQNVNKKIWRALSICAPSHSQSLLLT